MAKEQKNKNGFGYDNGRQILLDQRRKTSVCFCNHLKVAEKANWNERHDKYSVIALIMQDYSNGTGDKSFNVKYNISPRQLKVIHKWVSAIYPNQLKQAHLTMESVKVFEDYYSKLELIHNPKQNNCFGLKVTNGKADKDKKLIKGSERYVVQWYTGDLFFSMWADLLDFLRDWEMVHYAQLCRSYEALTAKAVEEYIANAKQYSNQPAQNAQTRNQQRYTQQQQNSNRQQAQQSYQQRRSAQQQNANRQQNQRRYDNELPPLAPPPQQQSTDFYESSFEETANYGSAYK